MSKPKRTLDRYDLEIEDIKAAIESEGDEEGVIHRHWSDPEQSGGLFSYCAPNRIGGTHCGCLTQVKGGGWVTEDPTLTKYIQQSSLPEKPFDVRFDHLSQFARWQRKMDAMWPGRGEMQMPEGFEERLRKANS